jgi:hypothetical protein
VQLPSFPGTIRISTGQTAKSELAMKSMTPDELRALPIGTTVWMPGFDMQCRKCVCRTTFLGLTKEGKFITGSNKPGGFRMATGTWTYQKGYEDTGIFRTRKDVVAFNRAES